MVTTANCITKWGKPSPAQEGKYMTLWLVPADILAAFSHVRFSALGTIGFPKKIYCNKLAVAPLERALRNMMERGLAHRMKTWDGCFNVRNKTASRSYSLHSWGIAIDRDQSTNRFGRPATLQPDDVKCWTDAGWDWGGTWNTPDGMHFQLKSI